MIYRIADEEGILLTSAAAITAVVEQEFWTFILSNATSCRLRRQCGRDLTLTPVAQNNLYNDKRIYNECRPTAFVTHVMSALGNMTVTIYW